MGGILGTIIVGAIVGAIARFLKPGADSMGWIMTIGLGILGSVVAKFAGEALGLYSSGEAAGWIASIVCAIILLFIYNAVTKK